MPRVSFRETRQVHIHTADWDILDKAAGAPRKRSSVVAALARALAAGDVHNFDAHLAGVQKKTHDEQSARMIVLRARRGVDMSADTVPTTDGVTPDGGDDGGR